MLQRTQIKGATKILCYWRFIVLALAMLLTVSAIPASVAATGTPYGSGAYGSGSYNSTTTSSSGTSTSTAGTPNTGEGLYTPGQASTRTSHTVNWIELAGGAALVVAGVAVFWHLTMHRHRSPERDS